MAEQEVREGTPVETSDETKPGELVVEVAPDDRYAKTQLSDEEVEKLAEQPADDEVARYAKDAQKRIKSMHTANQEWRRRVIRANNDLATATNLAQELYQENQRLRTSASRSETAMVEQAIQRAEAKLEQARLSLRSARAAQDIDAETKAQEEIARYVAEGDRLRLLKPSASGSDGAQPPASVAAAAAPPQPSGQQPPAVSAATQAWIGRNSWFNDPKEAQLRRYAMGIHNELVSRGITENTDPAGYFGTIDAEMRAMFPDRFKEKEDGKEPAPRPSGGRPVAVVGGTRVNGGNGAPSVNGKRHVTLTESQVRIAKGLGLTAEQYAMQLVKEGQVQ